MADDELCWMSAVDLARAIRHRDISPLEVVTAVLDRIGEINPGINAYVHVAAEAALAQARSAEIAVMDGAELGPLHGVPVGVKDTTDVRGLPTTMGSRLCADAIAADDAVVVERLRRAGAILIGKTNTSEFACKAVTDNLLFGPTRNPWNLNLTPGGSSGGSAAAVAAGLGSLATCNDAGGSVRIPASCCGVFGIKPQFGRVPSYPSFDHWETLSQEGAMGRTVADAALMLDVVAGPHWGDRHSLPLPKESFLSSAVRPDVTGLQVAYSKDLGYAVVSAEVHTLCEAAIKRLSAMGAIVEEARLDLADAELPYLTLINAELGAMVSQLGPAGQIAAQIHPLLVERVAASEAISAREYIAAGVARRKIAARVGRFLSRWDLLVTPMIGAPAWPIDSPGGYPAEIDGLPVPGLAWSLAHPFNLTGHPAASVPVGWTHEGLPVGLQVVAPACEEATVLRAAATLEQAMPWTTRKPQYRSKRSPEHIPIPSTT